MEKGTRRSFLFHRGEGEKKMAWLDWVIIGSIALLAGLVIGTRKRWGAFFDKFKAQERKRVPPEGPTGSPLGVAPDNARAQRDPAEEAATNGLTGVKTRRYFKEALAGEWRRASHTDRQFCLAMVDLDRFKQVNDRMGRLEGDRKSVV